MKQKTVFLPLLGTALLLALGLALPQLTAWGLDRRLAQDISVREDTPISLVLAANTGIYDSLTLFGAVQTLIPLSGGAQQDPQDVQSAAAETKYKLDILVAGEPSAAAVLPDVAPYLATSGESPARSGIFWRCAWTAAAGREEVVWLEDQTRRLAGFSIRAPDISLAVREDGRFELVESAASIPDAVANAAEFLCRYYGAEAQTLTAQSDFADSFTLLLTGPAPDDAAALSLRLSGGYLAYNF